MNYDVMIYIAIAETLFIPLIRHFPHENALEQRSGYKLSQYLSAVCCVQILSSTLGGVICSRSLIN